MLNCHHGINLIHISDCSDAYQTWFEKLMIKDIIPANSLLMIECWNISNISFISSQVAAADELCIAGIFTPSTPLIRHKNMIVNNLIPVKQIYLVIVLHKDHSFTTSQTSQFQSVFTQAGGSFGVAESNMKNGGNIPTNFLPAA